jgi:hypothetical protein
VENNRKMVIPDSNRNDAAVDKIDTIFRRTKTGGSAATIPLAGAEAFCIDTEEIYYLNVIYQDRNGHYHSHGHAVFESGEKVRFTITANGNETVREKCVLAGQRIARQYGGTLMQGKIDKYGKFYL